MDCRPGCAACCIVISISSPIPGMPDGKPAGVRCIHLTSDNLCSLFGKPERPRICRDFKADFTVCGETNEDAFTYLQQLEIETRSNET